jgi:DNA-binding transcriptional ArsR family regulator
MPGSAAEKRLLRLARSGISFCENAPQHAKELKQLAREAISPEVMNRQNRIFKALADETRLRILTLLTVHEMCVCEIMIALDLTQPTASHHLRILEGVGLVQDVRKGKWVFYKIANSKFVKSILKSDVR